MRRRNCFSICLVFLCAATVTISTGCRSMPGRNLFGFRKGPSAEMLAGSGPTATYPAPPSTTATPEAIASVAGGTAPAATKAAAAKSNTAQVAGVDISPGYATPAAGAPTKTNMAAAQANGFLGQQSASSSRAATPKPSGYTFGSKALTPKSTADSVDPTPSPASSYATKPGTSPAVGELKTPSTSFTPPPASSYTAPEFPVGTPKTAAATKPSGGYTLPTDAAAMAALAASETTDERAAESEDDRECHRSEELAFDAFEQEDGKVDDQDDQLHGT